ncbi:AFG1-like ATPase [Hartmannibacter diazotrophicus]|uniref:AFG1-like ATPase n=1 Tax=Hartmannibacter diazotrophicus TaxID=1482074 RepID=A0A2C9DDF2_9HYPH|nr:cell division protein ZapE [Hartmannibacter diazotrophicus]SON58273.1 AFG1-like ATPase [Hartmannibacter diazotrophicus]
MDASSKAPDFGAKAGSHNVSHAYDGLVARGDISADVNQKKITCRLDQLIDDLKETHLASKKSALGWIFGKRGSQAKIVKGAYIWGSVGRGKTMLMDLFFDLCPEPKKRRAHFLDFMADTHERIHKARQAGEKDPVERVGDAIAGETRLLCFDEFAVTDVADAMILGRLFTCLFRHGVVVVATSNVAPDDLYKDGLNRSFFLSFVALLKERTDILRLDSPTDYRLDKMSKEDLYVTPNGAEAYARLNDLWAKATAGKTTAPASLTVKTRRVLVPMAAGSFARFGFADLCEKPLGAQDFQAIVRAYHTIFLDDIPVMNRARRNEAKRFITLIDTLYDTGTKLVCSAASEPDGLYQDTIGTEAFEFQRCASRLVEMRSDAYLTAPRHLHGVEAADGDDRAVAE